MPTLVAKTSEIDGVPLVERLRALAYAGGVGVGLRWRMRDADGLPVDLSPYIPASGPMTLFPHPGDGPSIFAWTGTPFRMTPAAAGGAAQVRLKMAETIAARLGIVEVVGQIGSDPTHGEVLLALDPLGKLAPAVYEAQIAVLDPVQNVPAVVNPVTIYVERSMFAGDGRGGPPPMSEIRLRLRDSSPAESRLLDTLQFDDAEVAAAVVRVVRNWNETPPFLGDVDTTNFPYPDMMLRGVRAGLFDLAADWYRRNVLTSQAGGIAINDMDKAKDYEAAAGMAWADWRKDVASRKSAINIAGGWGSVPGRYTAWNGYGGGAGAWGSW